MQQKVQQNKSLNWQQYYEDNLNAYPNQVTSYFVSNIKKDLHDVLVVEIWVGTGNDAKLLLQHWATVIWIDGELKAKAFLEQNISHDLMENFVWDNQRLEDLKLPKNLITVSNKTLGFVTPEKFESMMQNIKNAIQSGWYFVGNFFGTLCDADIPILKHTKEEIDLLFSDFNIIYAKERKWPFPSTQRHKIEYRQIFDIIAQKK